MTHAHIVPKPGAAWAGSLMGTSIASTMAMKYHLPVVPLALAIVALGICVFVTLGIPIYRNPRFKQELMAPWGMYAMGILALGSAWTALTGNPNFQIVSWWIGTPLGIIVCLNQLRRFHGEPSFQWGLALVAPMVAATSSGQLSEYGAIYHPMGIICFFLTLCTATPIFIRAYASAMRKEMDLPANLSGTAWIPLGMVGQSTAAAQVLFHNSIATVYGFFMLTLGIPLIAWAMLRFYSGVLQWAGYTPGWWGSTFPTGTLCLGSFLLAGTTGLEVLHLLSIFFLLLLLLHWSLCVLRFGSWFLTTRAGNHPTTR